MTYDEITAERKRLFDLGGMVCITLPSGKGAMVAADPNDWEAQGRANRYNELAAQHARLERRSRWALPPQDPMAYLDERLVGMRGEARDKAYRRMVRGRAA